VGSPRTHTHARTYTAFAFSHTLPLPAVFCPLHLHTGTFHCTPATLPTPHRHRGGVTTLRLPRTALPHFPYHLQYDATQVYRMRAAYAAATLLPCTAPHALPPRLHILRIPLPLRPVLFFLPYTTPLPAPTTACLPRRLRFATHAAPRCWRCLPPTHTHTGRATHTHTPHTHTHCWEEWTCCCLTPRPPMTNAAILSDATPRPFHPNASR